jgi:uncharacterized membrane protein
MTPELSIPPEEKEKYHRLYDIGRDSFLEQVNRVDSLDRKAQINLVVIGIVVGFGLFKPELISDLVSKISACHLINSLQILCLALSFALFIVSLWYSILTLLPRDFQIYPDVAELSKAFESKRTEDLDVSMSNFFQKIINENEKHVKSKTKHLKKGIIYILIAFPFCVVFMVLTVAAKILDS